MHKQSFECCSYGYLLGKPITSLELNFNSIPFKFERRRGKFLEALGYGAKGNNVWQMWLCFETTYAGNKHDSNGVPFLQWDLVCTTEELAELTQALMTLGMMIGSIIGPSLSGR